MRFAKILRNPEIANIYLIQYILGERIFFISFLRIRSKRRKTESLQSTELNISSQESLSHHNNLYIIFSQNLKHHTTHAFTSWLVHACMSTFS